MWGWSPGDSGSRWPSSSSHSLVALSEDASGLGDALHQSYLGNQNQPHGTPGSNSRTVLGFGCVRYQNANPSAQAPAATHERNGMA